MKRILASLFLAAAALFGITGTASAAPIQTVTQGGVTCSQWAAYNDFPKTYWDCAHPSAPTNAELSISVAAQGLYRTSSALTSSFVTANTQIYIFNNAADYHAFTGLAAPAANKTGANNGSTIAATFLSATIDGATTDLSSYTGPNMLVQLGYLYDIQHGNLSTTNAVFKAAALYDQAYFNAPPNTPTSVWGSTIAGESSHSGQTPWAILGSIWGNTNQDLFAYQFSYNASGSAYGSGLLSGAVRDNAKNTNGWMANEVFPLSVPANKAVGTATNNVLCVAWKTGLTFPTSYNDCVHPYNPTNAEHSIVTGGAQVVYNKSAALAAPFMTKNTQIYVFNNNTDYHSYTGLAAPANNKSGGNNGSTIAAVFLNATIDNVATDLSSETGPNMLVQLGYIYDVQKGNLSTTVPEFVAAVGYDTSFFTTDQTTDLPLAASTIWGATLASHYPGQNAWQILGTVWGNTNQDLFAYQFSYELSGSAYGGGTLTGVIRDNAKTTDGWEKNYVFLTVPTNVYKAVGAVLCTQWSAGYVNFPSYWNCVHPANPQNAEYAVFSTANNLPSNLMTKIGVNGDGVQLYVMRIYSDYRTFFGQAALPVDQETGEYGVSNLNAGTRRSAVFANVYNTASPYAVIPAQTLSGSSSIMSAAMVHELGHQLDHHWGDLSSKAAFTGLRTPDFANLNIDPSTQKNRTCSSVFTTATCTKFSGVSPNSAVFLAAFPANVDDPVNNPADPHAGDIELFAEMFEHIESNHAELDLENGLNYFTQSRAYVQNLITNPPN